jgi:hypothetical protein
VTGSGTTYNVAVSGMTRTGTVVASLAAGVAHDTASNPSAASTSTDNEVAYDATAPTVTINQAGSQADPTNASPIHFTVVFSEPVSDFATGDVTLGGTAGASGHRGGHRNHLQRRGLRDDDEQHVIAFAAGVARDTPPRIRAPRRPAPTTRSRRRDHRRRYDRRQIAGGARTRRRSCSTWS